MKILLFLAILINPIKYDIAISADCLYGYYNDSNDPEAVVANEKFKDKRILLRGKFGVPIVGNNKNSMIVSIETFQSEAKYIFTMVGDPKIYTYHHGQNICLLCTGVGFSVIGNVKIPGLTDCSVIK